MTSLQLLQPKQKRKFIYITLSRFSVAPGVGGLNLAKLKDLVNVDEKEEIRDLKE
jgi:hypothetical protein